MVFNFFKFSIEKVLQKYGKCFLEMCGNPDNSLETQGYRGQK